VRYWNSKRKEVAEVWTGKRQNEFKKAGYNRVGVLGWGFQNCAAAESYAKNLKGNKKIGGWTRPLSFYWKKTSKKKSIRDYFTETADRYRKFSTHESALCVFTKNVMVAKPSISGKLVPIHRYYHRKNQDNLMATNPGDHSSAQKGGYCLMCGKKKVCNKKKIKKRLNKKECALGYLARSKKWTK